MAPAASPSDHKHYAKTLFQRVQLTCPNIGGGEHNWALLATYTDCDLPHNPHVLSCTNCGVSRLAIHFEDNDPEYEIFLKKEMWDEL